jgi:hypothetical protein
MVRARTTRLGATNTRRTARPGLQIGSHFGNTTANPPGELGTWGDDSARIKTTFYPYSDKNAKLWYGQFPQGGPPPPPLTIGGVGLDTGHFTHATKSKMRLEIGGENAIPLRDRGHWKSWECCPNEPYCCTGDCWPDT